MQKPTDPENSAGGRPKVLLVPRKEPRWRQRLRRLRWRWDELWLKLGRRAGLRRVGLRVL